MARRKPFYLSMVDSDRFLQLPVSTQALYFQLGMHTDDNSIVASPESVVKRVRSTMYDLHLLIDRGFAEYTEAGVRVNICDKAVGGAVHG